MFNKTKLGALLAGATLAATLTSPAAQAASGTVQVDITFPPLVILYYYDNIDVTVDADDLGDALIAANTSLGTDCDEDNSGSALEFECAADTDPLLISTGSFNTGELQYDADISNDAAASGSLDTELTVTLENSWAVRAIASSLSATVVAGSGDFTNPTISPTSPTPSMTLTDGDNVGDLTFDVDLDDMTGLTASDTLTITVVAP